MAALQTVAFGAASDGSQGDSVRTGFTKDNSNVAVLQKQATLTSFASTITAAQALTAAHVGQRVNINLATAGTVNLPSASTCAADNVLLLRNTGTTVVTLAITSGSGDTVALSKLNPGEAALMDTDGVHAWNVLMRGRSNSDNEVVAGTLAVTGAISANGGFSARPTWAGYTPWDSNNLASPATLNTAQTFTGTKTFSTRPTFGSATPWDSANIPSPVRCNSGNGLTFNWDASTTCVRLVVDASNIGSLVTGVTNGFHLTWTGSAVGLYVDSTSLGLINTTSDYRVKQAVSPLTAKGSATDLIKRLRPVTYSFRDFGIFREDGVEHVGFIAHEVQAVIPSGASGAKDAVDAEGNPEIQNLNVMPIVATLTAALQEALARIDALEAKSA